MNNKGFTLIEVLSVLVLISTVTIIVLTSINSTMSISKEESYKVMKNNIISAGYNYINECNSKQIECDFSFENNNRFSAKQLQNSGYFKDLNSPIDGKDLSNCLTLEATKLNGVIVVDLIDNCY